ncbi:MAG: glycosyltransferase family 2 protein [Bacteroidetes bacterium]|nr:glycosyltransferase family 2 protein [Bacteroidota bacterium]
MPPELSIIIVNYNVRDLLKNCISSIYRFHSSDEVEIIVVDNASTDDSRQLITTEFPKVVWIGNDHNAGFSDANNQGIVAAKSERILLLNPDTELKEDAIHVMLSKLKTVPDSDMVVPCLLNTDSTLQKSCWKFPGLMNIILESFYLHLLFRKSEYDASNYATDFSPQAASGAALMFHKALYRKIGGLDPDLFWMEDTDFGYRIFRGGGRIHFLSSAHIYHHSGKSSAKNLHVAIANQLISKIKYIRKHFSFVSFVIASLFIFIQIISRCIAFSLLSLFGSSFSAKRKAYFFSLQKFWSFLILKEAKIR